MTVRGSWFCFFSLFPSFLNELHTCARDALYFKDICIILVTFLGTTEHFCGKNEALRWSILVGKQKRNVQRANPILTAACQLTITWMSNINRRNALDSSQRFFLLGSQSHWGDRVREDQSWCVKSYISLHGGAAIRMDDFVTTKILGFIDNQIISWLPTALRCALRSRENSA